MQLNFSAKLYLVCSQMRNYRLSQVISSDDTINLATFSLQIKAWFCFLCYVIRRDIKFWTKKIFSGKLHKI